MYNKTVYLTLHGVMQNFSTDILWSQHLSKVHFEPYTSELYVNAHAYRLWIFPGLNCLVE